MPCLLPCSVCMFIVANGYRNTILAGTTRMPRSASRFCHVRRRLLKDFDRNRHEAGAERNGLSENLGCCSAAAEEPTLAVRRRRAFCVLLPSGSASIYIDEGVPSYVSRLGARCARPPATQFTTLPTYPPQVFGSALSQLPTLCLHTRTAPQRRGEAREIGD